MERPVAETDGVKQISSVVDGHLAVYDGTNWNTQFWNGVNLGATLPGHSPGDLAPSKKDYRRWFEQITDEGMNTDVLRVYSILPPHFYEALYESNSTRTRHAYGPGYQHGRFSGRILTLNVGGESRAVPATNQRERTV